MYGKPFIAGIALALAAVSPSAAAADSPAHQLKQLRLATTAFNSLDVAKAAGWDQDITGCLSSPEGGMGHHFMNDEIFFDGVVDPLRPELLVYAPTEHGGRRLVAVEYLVFSSALGSNPGPELFGHTFHLNPAIDAYVLHVWLWEMNPSGLFADWNPRVHCPACRTNGTGSGAPGAHAGQKTASE